MTRDETGLKFTTSVSEVGLSDLLPCPFCGGEAMYGEVIRDNDESQGGQFVECRSCGITTRMMFPLMDDVKHILREDWNRRVAR